MPIADTDTDLVPNGTPAPTTNRSSSSPASALPTLDASRLTITKTRSPKPAIAPNDPLIASQTLTTDHMLTATWSQTTGWSAPAIVPYGPLSIRPAASCLQYATECFEGMKCYRGHDGRLRLFRPQLNAARFLKSATRIALPAFAPAEFLKLMVRFVAHEGPKWLPDTPAWRGRFLYLRPTMIGTSIKLGLQRPDEAMMFAVAVFVPADVNGPADSAPDLDPASAGLSVSKKASPPTRMKLLASSQDMIRAWPGGFGSSKVGANYGPTIVAQSEARRRGYDQVLWLFGPEDYVTEAGLANFFVLWTTKDGKKELVTPPLELGVILEGVTRRSVLDICRGGEVGDVLVSERKVRMDEIVSAYDEGRMLEAFAVGTAVFVASISEIDFRGKEMILPLGKEGGGPFATEVKSYLEGIMFGRFEHEWGHIIEEE